MNVALLHTPVKADASKDDLDTMVQVAAVEAAVRDLGHSVIRVPFSIDMTWDLSRTTEMLATFRPDVVFNLVETVAGRCRFAHLATTFLDCLDLPYTGTPTEGLILCAGKLRTKQLLKLAGVDTPCWFEQKDLPTGSRDRLSGRYLVKSVWEHASLGLEEESVLDSPTTGELLKAMRERAPALGGECFAEAYVHGREFNLSILEEEDGPKVLPPAEIEFTGTGPDREPSQARIVGYKAKWEEDSPEYRSTVRRFDFARDDTSLLERLRDTALTVWRTFGLAGYARVDFRVDAGLAPQVIDVNANPGLAPDAGLAAAAARAGRSYAGLVEHILRSPLAKLGRPA